MTEPTTAQRTVHLRVRMIALLGFLAVAGFIGLAAVGRGSVPERMALLSLATAAGGYLAGAPRNESDDPAAVPPVAGSPFTVDRELRPSDSVQVEGLIFSPGGIVPGPNHPTTGIVRGERIERADQVADLSIDDLAAFLNSATPAKADDLDGHD